MHDGLKDPQAIVVKWVRALPPLMQPEKFGSYIEPVLTEDIISLLYFAHLLCPTRAGGFMCMHMQVHGYLHSICDLICKNPT